MSIRAMGRLAARRAGGFRKVRGEVSGAVLMVAVGLLSFHVPHFLLERSGHFDSASVLLMVMLLAILIGAIAAAIGISRGRR